MKIFDSNSRGFVLNMLVWGGLASGQAFVIPQEAKAETTMMWSPPAGTLGWCAEANTGSDFETQACAGDPATSCRGAMAIRNAVQFFGIAPRSTIWEDRRCFWDSSWNPFNDKPVYPAGNTHFKCATGYVLTFPYRCVLPGQKVKHETCEKNNGANVQPHTGRPIDILSGAKVFSHTDFFSADKTLTMDRKFISLAFGGSLPYGTPNYQPAFANWFSEFDIALGIPASAGDVAQFIVLNPDGTSSQYYRKSDGSLGAGANSNDVSGDTGRVLTYSGGAVPSNFNTLGASSSTWTFRDARNQLWTFQTYADTDGKYRFGRPTQLIRTDGTVLTLAYDSSGALTTVTDQVGKQMTLTWNMMSQGPGVAARPTTVASIALPGGTTLRYSYETSAGEAATDQGTRLTKVEYVNTLNVVVDSVSYAHENAQYPHAITKILDHTGGVRWKVTYDGEGRATRSEGPNGEELTEVAYTPLATNFTRTQTDALGRQTVHKFTKGSSDFDIKYTGADGVATANCVASSKLVTYNSSSQLETSTDEEGRVTKYTRNAAGQPTQTIEAFGTPQARTKSTTWHPTFSVPTQVVEAGLTTNYVYNAVGQITSVSQIDTTSQTVPYSTNGQTRTTTFTYGTTGGSKGKLVTIDGPLTGVGDTTSLTYNSNGYLASVTDAVGKATTVTAWDWRGAPLTIVDPNSVSTTLTYDIHGRLLTSTVNPGATQSQYGFTYDIVGNLTRITLPKGGYLDYTYDSASRLTLIKNEKNEKIELTPNNAGQPTLQVVKNAGGTIVAQQSIVYDEMGRQLRTLGAASTVATRMAYDKVNNLKQVTDGRDKVWQTGFDPLNRVIEQTNPEAEKVKYVYAANNALTGHKDGRNLETIRVLNGFGETIREVSPDSGTRTYWYDNAGRLNKTQDADGVETNYAYDNAGRLLSRTFTGAAWETQTFTYDSTTSGNKGNARLTNVTEQSGATAFVYDARGLVTNDIKAINGINYSVQYAYDTNGGITQMTLPSGRIVTLSRDNSGLVTAITTKPTTSGTVSNVATSIAYEPFGDLKSLIYGNGLTLTDTFNLNGWKTRIQVKDGSTPKFDLSYDFYDSGQLGEIVDNAATGRTVYMALSDSGRLTWAGGPWGQEAYDFDDAGNRIGSYLTVGATTMYRNEITEGASNRLTQVQNENSIVKRALSYRTGGDLYQDAVTGGDTYTYHYSSRKRLVVIKKNNADVANYGYDFKEQRVWRRLFSGSSSSEIHYIFDQNGHLLAEHNGYTGAVLREYIWLDEKPVAVIDSTGSNKVTYYIHSGHLNEPQMMTNSSKAKVWDAYVTPFGSAQVFNAGTANVDIRLPGQWFQAEAAGSGLNQNHYRDYDPSLGRYIQVDPVGIAAGQNPYVYVDGKPYDLVDPTGRFVPLVTGGIGAGFGAGGNILGQLYMNGGNWNCVNWKNVAIAGGVGFVSGALAPVVGGSVLGTMALGAGSNVAQYGISQYANGENMTFSGVAYSGVSGAVGGAIGGTVTRVVRYDPYSPYLDQSIVRALNNQATIKENTGTTDLLRNFLGSFVGNTDWPPLPGKTADQCGCK